MEANVYQAYLLKIENLAVSSAEKLALIAEFDKARELRELNDQFEALRCMFAPLVKKIDRLPLGLMGLFK